MRYSPLGNDVIHRPGAGVLPQEVLVLVASVAVRFHAGLGDARHQDQQRPFAPWRRTATPPRLMGINVGAIGGAGLRNQLQPCRAGGLLIAPITTVPSSWG